MATSSIYFFDAFQEDKYEKVHNLGSDTLEIALCNAANAPVAASDGQLSDLTQIAYTNLTADRTVTVSASSQTAGTYKIVIADKVLAASGGAVAGFRYVVLFNQTAANDELICYYDYGSDLVLADGDDITVDFDGSNGVFTDAKPS